MIRHYIAVFRGKNNVTNEVFNNEELISEYDVFGTEENLLRAIEYCKSKYEGRI
jgi:hypothetical protein